jgi:integrase
MASLQERNGSYRILFCYHGKLHAFTIGKVEKSEAENKARQVDYLLMRLKQRLIALPEGTDIVTFVEFDGEPPMTPAGAPLNPREAVTLSQLKDRYLVTHGNGTIEANSLDTCKLHLSHVCRILGDGFLLPELSLSELQNYVNRRTKAGISPVTVRKEIASFRAAWNWGGPMNLTNGTFPNRGLRYPKADEKPPFMTWAEIKRAISHGGNAGELWDCLYLLPDELAQLLEYVKQNADHGWIYPMFCMAAYTGARRSEMLRAKVTDVDLHGRTILIHEKKRTKTQRTTRRVPMSPQLAEVLKNWLANHPGGEWLFCQEVKVLRSKTKRTAPTPITRNESSHHLKNTLDAGKWKVLRGWHTLRHSFISACASKGVDQRLIDEWSGHSTEEQRKRYRHLFPDVQRNAMQSVFG